jgi:hypothetical protein
LINLKPAIKVTATWDNTYINNCRGNNMYGMCSTLMHYFFLKTAIEVSVSLYLD